MSWLRMSATALACLIVDSFIPSTSRAATVDEIALYNRPDPKTSH